MTGSAYSCIDAVKMTKVYQEETYQKRNGQLEVPAILIRDRLTFFKK